MTGITKAFANIPSISNIPLENVGCAQIRKKWTTPESPMSPTVPNVSLESRGTESCIAQDPMLY
jgi:hypothetical protein